MAFGLGSVLQHRNCSEAARTQASTHDRLVATTLHHVFDIVIQTSDKINKLTKETAMRHNIIVILIFFLMFVVIAMALAVVRNTHLILEKIDLVARVTRLQAAATIPTVPNKCSPEADLQSLKDQFRKLQAKKDKYRKAAKRHGEKLSHLRDQEIGLRANCEANCEMRKELQSDLQRSSAEKVELEKKLKALEDRDQDQESFIEEHAQKVYKLRKEIECLKEQVQDQEYTICEQGAVIDEMRVKIEQLEGQCRYDEDSVQAEKSQGATLTFGEDGDEEEDAHDSDEMEYEVVQNDHCT